MLQLEIKKSPNISLEILESLDLFLSILFILNKHITNQHHVINTAMFL